MAQPRPSHPYHRYSPVEDYMYDDHDETAQATHQPLSESAGNAQPHHVGSMALCHPHLALTPPLHSIPTPPIAYGAGFQRPRDVYRDVLLSDSSMAPSGASQNPIYTWKFFADYRAKVTQKESENEEAKWPLYLEDAFLDALLLIPQMYRKKYLSKGTLYGRNMLISEYLWICHWLANPPRPGEIIPMGEAREKHPSYRGRKQVSSHIQVMKGFFSSHPLFHFFFPRKADDKNNDRRGLKEPEGDGESFKNNPVLVALTEGRLPDERPNYEYFGNLLAGDSEVFVRPKTCWIYVSSSEVTLSDDGRKAYGVDGTCMDADAYTADGTRLEGKGDYPHLVLNSNKETRRDLKGNVLLHEYTRTLTQKESNSIREISHCWDSQFPQLQKKLLSALDETHPSHDNSSRCVVGPCDTIHFDVVLDLHATSQFLPGTHLDGVVHVNVCRPELANHSWRSHTSVVKPEELDMGSASDPPFWDHASDLELSGRGNARDTLEVPFPATSWANTFIALSKFVTAERERKATGSGPRSRPTRRGIKQEDGESLHKTSGKMPAVADLLDQVAMYQELWSAPNTNDGEPSWTRRAIILWTFRNASSEVNAKGRAVTVPAGTSWRFLTKIDPTSQWHRQRAYLSGSPTVARNNVMSPDPGYAHHMGAQMHEHFSSSAGYGAPGLQHHASLAPPIHMYDGYPSGMITPPHTACLPSTYSQSFDNATIASNDSFQHPLAADPTGSDVFLTGLGVPSECDPMAQSWAAQGSLQGSLSGSVPGSLQGLDAVSQWASVYAEANNRSHQQNMSWTESSGSMPMTTSVEAQWHAVNAPEDSWSTPESTQSMPPLLQHDAWASSSTCSSQPLPQQQQQQQQHEAWVPTMAGDAYEQHESGYVPGAAAAALTPLRTLKRSRDSNADDDDCYYQNGPDEYTTTNREGAGSYHPMRKISRHSSHALQAAMGVVETQQQQQQQQSYF